MGTGQLTVPGPSGTGAAFAMLLGLHPDVHFLIGTDGRIRALNEAAQQLIGVGVDVVGMPFDSWVPLESRPVLRERFNLALAGDLQCFRAPDLVTTGRELECEVTYVPVGGPSGVDAVLWSTSNLRLVSSASGNLTAAPASWQSPDGWRNSAAGPCPPALPT